MHELGISKVIIAQAEEICCKEKIFSAKKIFITLGALTNNKKEPIEYYFDILKKESGKLKNCKMIITIKPGKINCNDCKKTSIIEESLMIICKHCDSLNTNIFQGKECTIDKIEGN